MQIRPYAGLAVGRRMAPSCSWRVTCGCQDPPPADFTMFLSIKPVCVNLLSCIFFKEPVDFLRSSIFFLDLSGISFVIQPPFIFRSGKEEYTSGKMYAALALVAATALSGCIPVFLRRLRHLHWEALASVNRILCICQFLPVLFYLGEQCLLACGLERLHMLLIGVMLSTIQLFSIYSFKFEGLISLGWWTILQTSLCPSSSRRFSSWTPPAP